MYILDMGIAMLRTPMPQSCKSGKIFPGKAQWNDKAFLGEGLGRGPSVTE